jgi:hypothetical protein
LVFPCQYHSTMSLQTHVSSGEWTLGPLVAAVQRQPHPIDMIDNNKVSTFRYEPALWNYHCRSNELKV